MSSHLTLGCKKIWTKDMSIINNAYGSYFFIVETHTLQNKLFWGEAWGKKLEEYDKKKPNHTYFEKHYHGQSTPLDV